jgi:hypothetical protein
MIDHIMEILVSGGFLKIRLNWKEKVAAVSRSLLIPIIHVVSTDTTYSKFPAGLRMPGTCIPGLIVAGTYYTRKGKEFWLVTRKKNILRIDLKDEFYARLVLGVDQNQAWKEKLDSMIFPA